MFRFCAVFLSFFLVVSCTKKETAENTVLTPDQLAVHGKTVYQLNCVACHGADPKVDGPVGPSIAGSSKELIEARVMRTQYPDDYKPKRTSHTMVALPHLQNEIPALHAYLNSL